jgi:hypothetical protein
MKFLADALDESLFTNIQDFSLVDKFLSNDFLNNNLKFVLGDLPKYFTSTEPTCCVRLVDTGVVYDLANFLVNQLCSSVLIVNK